VYRFVKNVFDFLQQDLFGRGYRYLGSKNMSCVDSFLKAPDEKNSSSKDTKLSIRAYIEKMK